MALPYTIANGQRPDGNKLQANFAALLAGAGVGTIDSYADHKVTARAAPTVPFTCICDGSDGGPKGFYIFCGDVTQGDEGFLPIVTWGV